MADAEKSGMFDSILGKGEKALDKFMDDPEKVAKAKAKAEDLLAKHMDREQADKITNSAEEMLKNVTKRNERGGV
ncbi:MAG: hypothetical protein PVSMB7_24960 [Chloroflexota bacterium]